MDRETPTPGVVEYGAGWNWPRSVRPERQRREGRRITTTLVIYLMVFGVLFCGLNYGLAEASLAVELRSTVRTVRTADGELALVPYQRNGAAGVSTMIDQDVFQVRLAAVDLDDGEPRWDVKLTDELSGDGVVLAADARYSYVATDHGLFILATETGRTVAKGAELDGLGERALLAPSAYAYDRRTDAVVALATSGDVYRIPVGSTRARPAPRAVVRDWQGWLRAEDPFDHTVFAGYDETAESIGTPDGGSITLNQTGARPGTSRLELQATRGGPVTRGPEFANASVVLEVEGRRLESGIQPPTLPSDPEFESIQRPAGAEQGVVLVQHDLDVNQDLEKRLSVLDAETGAVLDRVAIGADVSRALTTRSGSTLLLGTSADAWRPNQLMLVNAEGVAWQADIGEVNLLGLPAGALDPWW